jgi:hypothetical protein
LPENSNVKNRGDRVFLACDTCTAGRTEIQLNSHPGAGFLGRGNLSATIDINVNT